MNTCVVWGSSCRMSSMSSRKVVGDRDSGLVVSKRRVREISLIDGREQERRVGEELLSILAREYRAGPATVTIRSGLGRFGESGLGCSRRAACSDAPTDPVGAHDDLDDVHGLFGALVQVDAEVAGELVDRQVAAVDRLQHQQLRATARWASLDAAPRRSKTASKPVDLQQGIGREAGVSVRQPSRFPRRSVVTPRLESHVARRRERPSDDDADARDHPWSA